MKELFRLLRYARRYVPALLASVVFMAIVGLSQGLLVRLIPLVFERVLNPSSADTPAVLLEYPQRDHSASAPLHKLPPPKIYITLDDVMPSSVHNIWTMVAIGIFFCFLAKGVCDYLGNYLINWTGTSAIMDLRQEVFDRVLHQDAQFFENNESGRTV